MKEYARAFFARESVANTNNYESRIWKWNDHRAAAAIATDAENDKNNKTLRTMRTTTIIPRTIPRIIRIVVVHQQDEGGGRGGGGGNDGGSDAHTNIHHHHIIDTRRIMMMNIIHNLNLRAQREAVVKGIVIII